MFKRNLLIFKKFLLEYLLIKLSTDFRDINDDYLFLIDMDLCSRYAYYVQTKLINHPGARNAISKIHFLKTLFSTPDPPKDVVGKSLIMRPDQIE